MKSTTYKLIFFFFALVLHETIAAQSYYPLNIGQKWTHQYTEYATSDANRTDIKAMIAGEQAREIWSSTEIAFEVRKDSIINGKTYKVIVNKQDPFNIQLVREDNGNFFSFNNETFKEDNFLKTDVKVGDLWLDYENAEQTIATLYIVVEKAASLSIKGKNYNDVIGIGQITAPRQKIIAILKSENPFLPVTYYAKGQGMIYSYRPYPLGDRYSDLEIIIKE